MLGFIGAQSRTVDFRQVQMGPLDSRRCSRDRRVWGDRVSGAMPVRRNPVGEGQKAVRARAGKDNRGGSSLAGSGSGSPLSGPAAETGLLPIARASSTRFEAYRREGESEQVP